MLEAEPGASPGRVTTLFALTAIDLEQPGFDRDTGFGVIDALSALQLLEAQQIPLLPGALWPLLAGVLIAVVAAAVRARARS